MTKYISVFKNKRMLITLLLGFSGGLPLALTGGTLQAWLSVSNIDVATIGRFALIGLPYATKFLWAPLMDLAPLPFFGLRRGWMILTQVGLFFSTIGLGLVDPKNGLEMFCLLAFMVAFFSASQDIVIDAYRTEIIEDKEELGPAASIYITGYRVAMVVSGGFALVLAQRLNSWPMVYFIMAMLNLIGMVTMFFAPEPKHVRKVRTASVRETVIQPFTEFFQRHGAMEILLFIMIYKLSTLMATALTTKFLLDLKYSLELIGYVSKGAGLVATILGTLVGGSLMIKFGLKKSLWIFGVVQSLVGVTFCLLARLAGHDDMKEIWLFVVICMDNFMMGLGTAALTGFMMNFASKQFTATSYALLTSVMAVARVILIAQAGIIVQKIGWDWFFISTVPLAIPGLLLLSRFDQWQTSAGLVTKRIAKFDLGLIALFVVSLISMSSDPIWQWLGMKEEGLKAVEFGAGGVLLVVALGLAKPYILTKSRSVKTA